MKLSEFRSNAHWQTAIELAPRLMQLADELPASEQMGLSLQMRQIMVDLPAAVAADLIEGTRTRQSAGLRLLAALELVEHVYPALDTADVRTAADAFVEQLLVDAKPAPAAVAPASLPAPKPAPAEVQVIPVPAEEPASSSSMPTIVSVSGANSSEDSHVHPDSSQQTP